MRLNPDFVLQYVGGDAVLIPTGDTSDSFHGIIRLNTTAAYIAEHLKKDTTRQELICALDKNYEGTEKQFEKSVDDTIAALRKAKAIIE